MEERHLESAKAILEKIHYLNIATVTEDGSPWNTVVSVTRDADLTFYWGSSPDNMHSQNIRSNGQVFATLYDSTAPEGTGEALYMQGTATEQGPQEGTSVYSYKFIPEKIWINDEAKNGDGSYKHDIRIELELAALKS